MTSNIGLVERERIRLQGELDVKKTQLERNKLGQFATPPDLAQDIVKYIFNNNLFRDQKINFLDPAVGTGSFFYALLRNIPEDLLESAVGIEIDDAVATIVRKLWEKHGLKIIDGDFTLLNPEEQSDIMANIIITNPPYVRHHHINRDDKIRLKNLIKKKFGYNINGLSGLYCYFILLSHFWLEERGWGVWLIPSEFMDVNYGMTIKKYLTEEVTLIHIHRFDPDHVQFNDALVSSSIVIFRKIQPQGDERVIFSFGGNINNPNIAQEISVKDIKRYPKWSHIPKDVSFPRIKIDDESEKLEDYFKIQRGIATGANKFFIMDRKMVASLGIPETFVKPILPTPRKLKMEVVNSDISGYPLLDNQLVVIDCNIPERSIEKKYSEFYNYLKQGKRYGVTKRYLIRKRSPWYRQEQRNPAPFLCTYMGRKNDNNIPFRFIWNKSKAISTNVYLLLYPIGILANILDQEPKIYEKVFDALKQLKTEEIISNGRVYGGGLYKIEPKELGKLSAKGLIGILKQSGYSIPTQKKLSTWV